MPPPLQGIKILEFAGWATSPFCGLLCADYGADVVRVDRAQDRGNPTPDLLYRHKRSICIDLKDAADIIKFKALVRQADVLIEPFRPGTMEKYGLGPEVLMKENRRLVYARVTGFRRDSGDKDKAGHSISGGASCFQGILLALFVRERTGCGQVVDANMVDGAAYLATFPRLMNKTPGWEKSKDTIDPDCPYYNTYETADGKLMAVAAFESHFFQEFMKTLGVPVDKETVESRQDREIWKGLREVIKQRFRIKTRHEWERVFGGVDACVTPVYTDKELDAKGYERQVPVELSLTPGLKIEGEGKGKVLIAGQHQDEVFDEWLGGPQSYVSVAAKSRL
ncbi:hypothetical protein TWF281_010657 [Arthrobotrys megalospora]